MSERKLDRSYTSSVLLFGAHEYARKAATRNTTTPELLQQLGLSKLLAQLTKDRRKRILEHFEVVGRQLRRQCFTDLVSSFESDLFKLIGHATSKARLTLKQHYDADCPFAADRGELVRTPSDFSNLGGYKRLLARPAASDHDARQQLWNIISHRDFLAHGERWEPPASPPSVEIAYRVLSAELDRVTNQQSARR